jgi:HlyD family secretion protein
MPKFLELLQIFFHDRKLLTGILSLQIIFLLSSLFELVGISSIGPLFFVLSSGPSALDNAYLKIAYDLLDPGSFQIFAIYLSLLSITAILMGGIFSIISFILLTRLATYGGVYLGNRVFQHYLAKEWAFYLEAKKSKIINEIYQETSRVTENILVPSLIINKAIYLVIFLLSMLFFINWQLTSLFFFILAGLYSLIYFFLKVGLNKNSEELTQAHEGRFKFLDETFTSIKEIHIWNNANIFLKGFHKASVRWSKALRRNMNSANLPRFFIESFILLSICIVALVSFLNNEIDLATLLPTYSIFIFSALKLLPALQQIYNGSATIAGNKFSLINLHNILYLKTLEVRSVVPINQSIKSIELQDINFQYKEKGFSLKNISFKASQGNVVGITGFSGSGKSTMIDILMGLLHPMDGMILLNGQPASIYENTSWFNSIAYLPQKINILNENILTNIKFSNDPVDNFSRLRDIEQQSNITEFFDSNRMDDFLDVHPKNLSGGQLQRLGIARALYKNTNILFFDEPTSALDNLNKQHFIKEIAKFKDDKIIFIVTHDVDLLKHSDQVLIMEDGEFEYSGTFQGALENSIILQKLIADNT